MLRLPKKRASSEKGSETVNKKKPEATESEQPKQNNEQQCGTSTEQTGPGAENKDHASTWMALSTTKKLRLLFERDGPFKIELRRFDENDNKTEFGLILDVGQTTELLKLLPILVELYRAALLDDEPINVKYCLGKTSFVRINYEILCLDIRRFYIRRGETELRPTKKGIALNYTELKKMKEYLEDASWWPTMYALCFDDCM